MLNNLQMRSAIIVVALTFSLYFIFPSIRFFVFENSNCHKVSVKGKEYQVYWYQNPIDELIKGQWLVYNFSWKSLCEYPNGNVFNSNMINPHC